MPYRSYSGPNKPDKGQENGSCNRGLCQDSGAKWYNHGSFAWYCDHCKVTLDDEWAKRNWAKEFHTAYHPQFETREMMDRRQNIQNQVIEMLDNVLANGYPHNYRLTPREQVAEIVDYSGLQAFDFEQDQDMQAAMHGVEIWRGKHTEENATFKAAAGKVTTSNMRLNTKNLRDLSRLIGVNVVVTDGKPSRKPSIIDMYTGKPETSEKTMLSRIEEIIRNDMADLRAFARKRPTTDGTLKYIGAGQKPDRKNALVVCFDRDLTDEEISVIHNVLEELFPA